MPVAVHVMANVFKQPHDIIILSQEAENKFTVIDITDIYVVDMGSYQCSCELSTDFDLPCPHIMYLSSFVTSQPETVAVPLRWLRSYNRVTDIPLSHPSVRQNATYVHYTGHSTVDLVTNNFFNHWPASAVTSFYNAVLAFQMHPEEPSVTIDRPVMVHNDAPLTVYAGADFSPSVPSSPISDASDIATEAMMVGPSFSQDASTIRMVDSSLVQTTPTLIDGRTVAQTQPVASTSQSHHFSWQVGTEECGICEQMDGPDNDAHIDAWEECPFCSQWFHLAYLITPPTYMEKICARCERHFE
jgi:hypothetical protein